MDDMAAELGLTGMMLSGGSFMLGVDYPKERAHRVKLFQEAQREAVRRYGIRDVIVIARWPEGGSDRKQFHAAQAGKPAILDGFAADLIRMRGEFIKLGVDNLWVNLPWPVQRLDMTLYNQSVDPNQYAISADDYIFRHGGAVETLIGVFAPDRLIDLPGAALASSPLPGRYPLRLGDDVLYTDDDHPSVAGAGLAKEILQRILFDMASRRKNE
jgi:hypothetical protein